MTNPRKVWVVDDDQAIRFVLERALKKAEYRVRGFGTVAEISVALERGHPDVIVTDIHLPDADGLSVLNRLDTLGKDIPVIAITGYSDLDQAVSAFQKGVFEYIAKPFDLEQVITVVDRAIASTQPNTPRHEEFSGSRLIGDSPAMQEVFRTIGRLSRSAISVLITGETGTGKEVVARALHEHSPKAQGPFVAINTAAIPSELLESELFGHERGAFTGAHARRAGRFEEASGGTLFLDEIGDMPLTLQTRLLRVLAEGDFYRVGGRDLLNADVRVIAATHQDLEGKIDAGLFREDLYHRLNVINIALPPLRERRDDIPLLARYFLRLAARDMGLEEKDFRPETYEVLSGLRWPGNIRQLQNLCQQMCVMAPGERIFPEDLPRDLTQPVNGELSDGWSEQLREWVRGGLQAGRPDLMTEAREALEKVALDCALEFTNGKRIEAARLLGVGRNTLTRKLKELGVSSDTA